MTRLSRRMKVEEWSVVWTPGHIWTHGQRKKRALFCGVRLLLVHVASVALPCCVEGLAGGCDAVETSLLAGSCAGALFLSTSQYIHILYDQRDPCRRRHGQTYVFDRWCLRDCELSILGSSWHVLLLQLGSADVDATTTTDSSEADAVISLSEMDKADVEL